MADIYIGNVKGPQGETGATGATGPQGEAATINVGSVSTTAYGNPAQVVNVGTESEAVLNFVIPQGRPGQATTTMGGLTLDTITTSTADFPSPQVGDTGATAFGKIVKFFSDTLASLTGKLDKANVANNLTTTEAGYALDARQGKALNDSLVNIGKYYDSDQTSKSVNSSTWGTITTLEVILGGRYVITGDLSYSSDTTGIRILLLDVTESTTNDVNNSVLATGRATLSKTRIVLLQPNTTLYLRAYQTSGAAMAIGGRIRAVRISN